MKIKIVKAIIALLVITGISFAGIRIYKNHKKNANPVKVYSIQDSGFVGNYYEYGQSVGGMVVRSESQEIYIQSDQVIASINATVGDAVKAGDVLLSYDTTKDNLSLESASASLGVYESNQTTAQHELDKLKKLTAMPDEPKVADYVKSLDEDTYNALLVATSNDAGYFTDEEYNNIATIKEQYPIYKDYLDKCTSIRASNAAVYGISTDEASKYDYTATELAKEIRDKEASINGIDLQIDNQDLAIRKKKKAIGDSSVKATLNGIVTSIDTSEENIAAGKPIMVISTDGSYSCQIQVDEYQLETMTVGDAMSVTSYDNGMTYDARVAEISLTPSTDNTNYAEGTSSYYPVTLAIDDSEGLEEGSYVDVQMNSANAGNPDEIVLPIYLTKKENGNYYVLKNKNGKLVKTQIKTGKIYWGSEIVVKDGLEASDAVAFPYSKDAKPGSPCVQGSIDDLQLY